MSSGMITERLAYRDGQIIDLCFAPPRPLWQKDGSPLPIQAPEHFHVLIPIEADGPLRWFSDGLCIYAQAQQGSAMAYEYYYAIPEADPASFTVLNQRYARDARHAYYITGKTIRTRSAESFITLPDKHPLLDAHGNVTELCDSYLNDSGMFATDGSAVYVCGSILKNANADRFRLLPCLYASDGERVFYRGKPVDADAASFVAILQDCGDGGPRLWACDRDAPFAGGQRQLAADPQVQAQWNAFFACHPELTDYWWHRNQTTTASHQPRYQGIALQGLDADSFAIISLASCWGTSCRVDLLGDRHGCWQPHYWLPDDGQAYVTLEPVSQASISSIRELGSGYFTDGQHIFLLETGYSTAIKLGKADANSFHVLQAGWARDARHFYYAGVAKQGIDAASFQQAGHYAWDRQRLFSRGKPLQVDAPHSELRSPHPEFLIAGDKLYYDRRPVSTRRIHLPSLTFIGSTHARDRHRCYAICETGLRECPESELPAPASTEP
ncbi:DKNYY domain-containing protein [Chitinilyticum piscinae]|uniref:DKNYY domain-containing protein n=1 Tax=Chitinilyticum piscinae TaxID=2866724 RepID=A0A8J7K378_9NEIS|nr:DKNYY domain-containing protein [Chitinilyticum piscinae]MBE9611017.1 DKNYY domain-containing protein [Chitinilyticum piscinae]